jgi:protein O-GlcNAc transferase
MTGSLAAQIAAAAGHYAAGRYDEAAAAYRRALALAPSNAGLRHNLGVALAGAGRTDEAASVLAEAARLDPASAAAWLALGYLEFGRDRLDAAEAAFANAAGMTPASFAAQYNLGYVRHEQGNFAGAIAPLEIARALDPANEQAWYQIHNTRLAAGDAEAALREFLAFEPHAARTARFLRAALEFVRALGEPRREPPLLREVFAFEFGADDLAPLAGMLGRLQYFDVAREDLRRLYDAYDRLMQRRIAGATPLAASVRRPGKLRIGYLSADFRQHVMGRLMADVIGAHDRDRYAIHLYAVPGPFRMDALTDRFRTLADRFVELPPRSDLEAARAIAADDCDVLVDLMGHTTFSRSSIYMHKPARRIVTHLASHGAIGIRQVDFKLTDRHADVADAGLFQIERPLPMASCVLPFRRAARGGAQGPSRVALGIPEDAVVIGEFVTVQKLSPRCLSLWREVLRRASAALLLFSPTVDAEIPSLRRQLAGHGIDLARVAFAPAGIDEATAAARYDVVDLVLDTLPYAGGDTTLAALDAGVPVVTLEGLRHAERMGVSILRHAGLDEFVTTDECAYVELAVALATDASARARAAAEVRERFSAAAATFPARYTRDLEAALEAAIAAPV